MSKVYDHINVSDPLVKLAVSECKSNGYETEDKLCAQMCAFAGNSGIELLNVHNPSVCPHSCEKG